MSWESVLEALVLASFSAKVTPEHIEAAFRGPSSCSGPDMDPSTPSTQSGTESCHGDPRLANEASRPFGELPQACVNAPENR